jgi:hypothetical protein
MSKEKLHKREYNMNGIIRRAKLHSDKVKAATNEAPDLTDKQTEKLGNVDVVKIPKFSRSTAHTARARENRKITEQMGTDYENKQTYMDYLLGLKTRE